MGELTDKIRQEQLAWACRRLEALDKMEVKLREMRVLAEYAASRNLGEIGVAQVQNWMDILKAEVHAIDRETAHARADGLEH
jgi:hypothetical protein